MIDTRELTASPTNTATIATGNPETHPLQAEEEYFKKHKSSLLLTDLNRHAVVCVDEKIVCWDTYKDAMQFAYMTYGITGKFLVKKVEAIAFPLSLMALSNATLPEANVAA